MGRTAMARAGYWLAVAIAITFSAGPFLWQVLTSLRPEGELLLLGWPSSVTLVSYRAVWGGRAMGQAMLNSALVAAGTTVSCLAIGSSAAFALAKLEFRGRKLLLGGALAISMFPPIATLGPLYLVIRSLGLRDELGGLVLTYATFALPLTLWILTGFFRDLPEQLYEAARIDGCTAFQAFRHVLLPLAAPGVATAGILVFVFAYNEFLYALTFTSSPEKRTIPVAISLFASEHKEPWGEIAAASVMAVMPLLVVAMVFQRRIVAGLTSGGVKE